MGNPLGNLLSGLTGGSNDPSQFLNSLLSGGGAQNLPTGQMGGLGNVLNMITQGGGTNAATNNFLGPLVGSLGRNLNLSPDVAEQVVSFATHHLVNGHLSGTTQHQDLINQMTSGKVSVSTLQQSGLAQELAKKANIDPKVAADGLKHVLEHFGQQMK